MKPTRMTVAEFRALHGASPVVNMGKPQIRVPKRKGPNKTEAAWMRRLESAHPKCQVLYEPFSLNLPGSIRYTPDFVVMDGPTILGMWEVKGSHLHGSAGRSIAAWKVARETFKSIRFGFAQLRGTIWNTTID